MSNLSNYTRDLSYGDHVQRDGMDRASKAQQKWSGWVRIAFILTAASLLWGGIFWALSSAL
jgi:hypothetical protein